MAYGNRGGGSGQSREPKDNSGVLFKNDRKREGSNDADYTGSCIVNGQEMWMNAWIKESKNGGGKFMSFSFRSKDGMDQRTKHDDEPF